MKRQLPSQLLEDQFFGLATCHAPLSDSIRLGAQLMLLKAVELEVTEFLGRDHYQRSGGEILQGYRNGYEDKQVQTAEANDRRNWTKNSAFPAATGSCNSSRKPPACD